MRIPMNAALGAREVWAKAMPRSAGTISGFNGYCAFLACCLAGPIRSTHYPLPRSACIQFGDAQTP